MIDAKYKYLIYETDQSLTEQNCRRKIIFMDQNIEIKKNQVDY